LIETFKLKGKRVTNNNKNKNKYDISSLNDTGKLYAEMLKDEFEHIRLDNTNNKGENIEMMDHKKQ